jgi:hypothetical protein
MRGFLFLCVLSIAAPVTAFSQTPQTKDSTAKADSIARADSIALVRELENVQSTAADTTSTGRTVGPQGATNPRLLPDISAVGDMVADLSPDGSTQEGGERFAVREVEVAIQAAVDPYFRGDIFLGISDEEGIAIEQAYLTATALPGQLEARLGRFLMPFGKQNTTHRHDLHTVEYPYVIQKFFGPEGLKGTGLYASRVFAPLGFYQEVIVTAVDRFGEAPEDLVVSEAPNKKLSGLGYSARLRNYWDINESTNLELSFSGITGKREMPLDVDADINAVNARQSVLAADVTYRWRPLQRGLYKSLILQAEVMHQRTNQSPSVQILSPGEQSFAISRAASDYTGGYAFGRYQIAQRGFLGARFDYVEDPDRGGANTRAASGYLEFFPSEFSKLVAAYERFMPGGGEKALNRILLQAAFALGPHKPHPF